MWSVEYLQIFDPEVSSKETNIVKDEEESSSASRESSTEDITLRVPLASGAGPRRKSSVDSRRLLSANEEFNSGGLIYDFVSFFLKYLTRNLILYVLYISVLLLL